MAGAWLLLTVSTIDSRAQAPERPRISGIAHVTFRTSQPGAADDFYRSWLGLPQEKRRGCQVYGVGPRQRVQLEPGLKPGEDERLVSLGLVTESADRMRAWLQAKGIAAEDARRCDQRVVRTVDPEGHVLEFVDAPAPLAGGAQAASRAARSGEMRILHAGLSVKDVAAMDKFYADLLGFSEIWRGGSTDAVVNWINMKTPDGTEYIEYMLVGSEPLTRNRLGSMHHVAIVVDDMQDAYEAVLARVPRARWKDLGSPRVGRNRRWQLNLFDPDGSRTELMERHPMR
jgi:catechol 2,3-dioxygenase-like lactoylglutathione lyase family enzyme